MASKRAKFRVPLWGRAQGYVSVEADATKGATVGVDLYRPDGSVVTEADLARASAAATGGNTGGIASTVWALVQNIPANIAALAALVGSGFVRRAGDGTWSASALAASEAAYDNGTSGLSASDVQEAIDEVASKVVPATAWLTIKKTSDELRASTTSMSADSDLTVPLDAGKTYNVRGVAYFTISTNNGYLVDLDYSGSIDYVQSYRDNSNLSIASPHLDANYGFSTNALPSAQNGTGGANPYLRFEFHFTITTATAGTLALRWAQSVSSTTPTILRRGSYMEVLEF